MGKTAEIKGELRTVLADVQTIAATAEKDGREFTGEERTRVADGMKQAGELKARLATAESDEELRKSISDLGAQIGVEPAADRPEPKDGGAAAVRGTLGERFTGSDAFKGWMQRVAPDGRVPDSLKGFTSPAVQFDGLKDMSARRGGKALLTGAGDNSGGAFVVTERTNIFEPLGRRPLTIRDLIDVRTTGSDAVEYVRMLTRVNAAATVPEATTAAPIDGTTVTNAAGGLKPEGGMTFEVVKEAVSTVAEWVPATRRALSDVGQLRGLIDDELEADLEEHLEDLIVSGDGTGENFTGILNTSGTQVQPYDTDLIVTTRKARTKAKVGGRVTPTGWALHPNDWERIDLTTDLEGRYRFGGPLAMGTPTLWGLPVVESEAVPEGVGILGDWRKAVLWDREQAQIFVSDSHADFFVRNLVAVLAELRAAFGVIRPAGFVEVDLTAGV